ncbi:MAG: hypothetical protein LBO69_06700 [Ignavibacteria bacterium]|nr:hypothetical protein [Ignavibacteria bacterium]
MSILNNELTTYSPKLNDLSGTFDDLGQLIAYMRDLTKSLVPLSDALTDTIENLPAKVSKFVDNNPGLMLFTGVGAVLIGGALATTIINNCMQIRNNWRK